MLIISPNIIMKLISWFKMNTLIWGLYFRLLLCTKIIIIATNCLTMVYNGWWSIDRETKKSGLLVYISIIRIFIKSISVSRTLHFLFERQWFNTYNMRLLRTCVEVLWVMTNVIAWWINYNLLNHSLFFL